jgi:hypothetical protein
MLTRDDLIDLIISRLPRGGRAAPAARPAVSGSRLPPLGSPKRKLFVSEHEIKKMLTAGGKRLTIPKDSIVSPLAQDWLTLRGIEIVRE